MMRHPRCVFDAPFESHPHDVVASRVGTIVGATHIVAGPFGGAYKFDGSDDYISYGSDNELNITGAMTLEAWIRLDGTPDATEGIVTKYSTVGTSRQYKIGVDTNRRLVFLASSDGSSSSTKLWAGYANIALTLGAWTHVAAAFTPSATPLLYVSGSAYPAVNYYGSVIPASVHASATDLQVGAYGGGTPYSIAAAIDEPRIWNVALSVRDIGRVMLGLPPLEV